MIRFDSIRFDSIRFDSIRFNSIQFDLIWFDLIRFDSIQFNSIQFNSIQFNSNSNSNSNSIRTTGTKFITYTQPWILIHKAWYWSKSSNTSRASIQYFDNWFADTVDRSPCTDPTNVTRNNMASTTSMDDVA